jgi:REP element-mobilizing transposase RayT
MAQLFKKNILIEKLENFEIPNFEGRIETLKKWYNLCQNETLKNKKEEELEWPFWDDLFWKVLDYNSITENEIYNRKFQPKVPEWWQKADIGLWFFGSENEIMKVIIELKDSNTSLDKPQQRAWNLTPVQQAFKYKPYFKECDFVIVSNFYETRLYIDNYYDFEVWTLTDLVNPKDNYFNFRKFYYLLSKENFIAEKWESNTKSLISIIRTQEKEITKKFYSEYSLLRKELFKDIVVNNNIKKSELDFILNKTQKIIDRIIFIHFCEDLGLLPTWKLKENLLRAEEIGFSPWEMLKKFFEFINSWSERLGIPDGYNGWLFKEDKELNKIKIWNEICKKFVNLWDYDFANDLSVNILGHIFEQSISDIEEIKDQLSKDEDIWKTSKRKKDGIFYTPEYIVDYIVKNSVGKKIDEWEEELKEKHNLKEEITDKNYTKRAILVYEELKEKVENIKVLDPACWSGAFLVKVFDFLLDKNKEIANKLQDLWINQGLFSSESYFKTILQNNIYWVDLNEESVEITKLGLWLKTAQKGKKLANLDKNIKCGNSLIDDENIAWNKAFKWEEEFSDIFNNGKLNVYNNGVNPIVRNYETPTVGKYENNKKAFHITWVTHNSRVSERMIQYKVEKWEWVYFDEKQEVLITWYIRDIVKEDNLKVLAYNICKDHIHILLVCEENNISNIVRELKWKTARLYNKWVNPLVDDEEVNYSDWTKYHLWAQKFHYELIESDKQLNNTLEYIENNRIKHELPLNKGLQPLVQEMLCSYDEAFDSEKYSRFDNDSVFNNGSANNESTNNGAWPIVKKDETCWFDVIIGNPPYVSYYWKYAQNISSEEIKYYLWLETFIWVKNNNISFNLIMWFFEKYKNLVNSNGYVGVIVDQAFSEVDVYTYTREFIEKKFEIDILIKNIFFPWVIADTAIIIMKKNRSKNYNFKFGKFDINNELVFVNSKYLKESPKKS